jgi:hypothetical protein
MFPRLKRWLVWEHVLNLAILISSLPWRDVGLRTAGRAVAPASKTVSMSQSAQADAGLGSFNRAPDDKRGPRKREQIGKFLQIPWQSH